MIERKEQSVRLRVRVWGDSRLEDGGMCRPADVHSQWGPEAQTGPPAPPVAEAPQDRNCREPKLAVGLGCSAGGRWHVLTWEVGNIIQFLVNIVVPFVSRIRLPSNIRGPTSPPGSLMVHVPPQVLSAAFPDTRIIATLSKCSPPQPASLVLGIFKWEPLRNATLFLPYNGFQHATYLL